MVVHGSSCHGWLCSCCDLGLLPNRGCRMGSTVSDGPTWTGVFSRSFSHLFRSVFHVLLLHPFRTRISSLSHPNRKGDLSGLSIPSKHETRRDLRHDAKHVLRRAAHHVRARALVRRISRRQSTSCARGKDVDVATRGTERVVRRGSFGRIEKKDWLRIRSSCRSRCRSLRRAKQAQVSRNQGFQRTGRSFRRNECSCET